MLGRGRWPGGRPGVVATAPTDQCHRWGVADARRLRRPVRGHRRVQLSGRWPGMLLRRTARDTCSPWSTTGFPTTPSPSERRHCCRSGCGGTVNRRDCPNTSSAVRSLPPKGPDRQRSGTALAPD